MGYTAPGPPALSSRAASGILLRPLLSHALPGPPHRSRDQLPPGTGKAHWAAAMLLRSRDAEGTSAFRRPRVPPPWPRPRTLSAAHWPRSSGLRPLPAGGSVRSSVQRVENRWWELYPCYQFIAERASGNGISRGSPTTCNLCISSLVT